REPPLNWRGLDGDVAESGRFDRGLEDAWAAQPKRSRWTSRGFGHHPEAPQDGRWKRLKRVALRAPPDHDGGSPGRPQNAPDLLQGELRIRDEHHPESGDRRVKAVGVQLEPL